jgi:hypothetical protein
MFPLAAAPDCTEPYHGAFVGASLLVVGRGTDNERIFVRGQRTDALRYAKARKTTLDHVQARALCHDAVLAVLGT